MAAGALDLFSKTLLRESGPDFVAWLTGRTPIEVSSAPTELILAETRTSDHIVRALFAGRRRKPHYLYVELQSAGDPRMPRRMLNYWTRAVHNLSRCEGGPVPVSSFVIYLNRNRYTLDPGELSYEDDLGTRCLFRYRVVKLWEIDAGTVLGLKTPFLAPLAPLMRSPDPAATMLQSVAKILEADPGAVSRERKADLCESLTVFAELVVDPERISKMVYSGLEAIERESSIVKRWLKQGGVRAQRRAVMSVLSSRFGRVDKRIRAYVQQIKDPRRLQALLTRAAVARSLREFAREIPE